MNLFISYRRADTEATARSLQQKFLRTPDVAKIFLDHDAIPKGKDFTKVINQAIRRSAACIILIGPNWRGVDAGGTARMSSPDDFVRREVEMALQGNRKVIVVLTDDTPMPKAHELPESLHPLLRINAIRLRQADFKSDTDKLLDAAFGVADPPSRWDVPRMTLLRALLLATGGALFAAAVAVVAALVNNAATACPDVNCTVRGLLGLPQTLSILSGGGETTPDLLARNETYDRAANVILILLLAMVFALGVALPFLWRKIRRLTGRT